MAPEQTSKDDCIVDNNHFTVFSRSEKRLLVTLAGLSMLFSTLTANIYFPAINKLADNLDSSIQFINLTITTYLVFQAIAPALFGDVADVIGRRPALLIMFSVYTVANLGLAIQNNSTTLLILRMIQSLGCSATVAVSYGIFADIATAAERGGMVGTAMIATNLGPPLAPLIGGVILAKLGWRWIFWFLLICGGLFLLLTLIILPETARNIVGNGSELPKTWRRPLISTLFGVHIPNEAEKSAKVPLEPTLKRIPNPFRSVRVLFHKDSSVILLISGIFYMIYYCLQTSISILLLRTYKFHETVVGICYLSIGFGVVTGGYLNGKLLDYNYQHTAKSIKYEAGALRAHNLMSFPIENARLQSTVYLHVVHLAAMVGYGWMFEKQVVSFCCHEIRYSGNSQDIRQHVSGPLVLQFVLGFLETCIVQTLNTLLVDVFQETPSAAAAAGNIVRCGLSATGIATMEPLMHLIGPGYYFTFLALVGACLGLAGGFIINKKGMT